MSIQEYTSVTKVGVNDWQNRRALRYSGTRVALQLTSSTCGCSICRSRVECVLQQLEERKDPGTVEPYEDGFYLVLPLAETDDPKQVVSQATGFELS